MRDFTQVGKVETKMGNSQPSLARSRRIILMALYGSAAMFATAGVWLFIGGQQFLPREIVPVLAIAFFITAVMDMLAVAIMKKIWARDVRR